MAKSKPTRRKIYRHENDKGSVIEFNMYGKKVKLFVPDAQYRPELASGGTYGNEFPLASAASGFILGTDAYDRDPLPMVLNDDELQKKFPDLSQDSSATLNTDALERASVDAAIAARSVDVGLGKCSLPNAYELMVIFLEADRLDHLDPTFEYNRSRCLGCKSTFGRFDIDDKDYVWSSTQCTNMTLYTVSNFGIINGIAINRAAGIIPVLEL